MNKINHLPGISSHFVETDRLRMHLLTAGDKHNVPVLFLHGNTCTSTIWEEFMLPLGDQFYCVAPDMRGFGATEKKVIDATRGIEDWLDDITALIATLDLSPFHLVGHSLGGFVCWGLIARHAADMLTVSLIAPGPPMGFGGIHGEQGKANNPDYSGSGAGIVMDAFVDRLTAGDRSKDHPLYSPRNMMNRLFWKEGFTANREEDILTAMMQIHTGDKYYPGDYVKSEYWPGVAPGRYGPVNAMSPKYNQSLLHDFLNAKPRPPLLWIHGRDDHIISDASFSDPGYQGKLKLREHWPGDDVFPPQPLCSQVEYSLRQYASKGGEINKKMIDDCGHTPFIEKPEITKQAFLNFITKNQ